jgi:hypothetical protein
MVYLVSLVVMGSFRLVDGIHSGTRRRPAAMPAHVIYDFPFSTLELSRAMKQALLVHAEPGGNERAA